MVTTFEELLAPVTPDEFFGEYYGRKPLHVPGAPDKFAAAMSWGDLNRILAVDAFWTKDNLRLYQDVAEIPAEDYCRSVPGLGARVLRPDPDLVKARMSRGASLVLNSIDTLTPGIRSVADVLERTLLGYAQLNLYCSFAGHKAFDSHFDTHEVFALHAEGEKTWSVYEGRLDNPVRHPAFLDLTPEQHRRNRGGPMMEVRMTPGDLLYLPRGQYHDALASSGATLHLTFGVIPVRGIDLLELLEEEVVTDGLFRRDLPRPDAEGGADDLRERLAELGDRLARSMRDAGLPRIGDPAAAPPLRNPRRLGVAGTPGGERIRGDGQGPQGRPPRRPLFPAVGHGRGPHPPGRAGFRQLGARPPHVPRRRGARPVLPSGPGPGRRASGPAPGHGRDCARRVAATAADHAPGKRI